MKKILLIADNPAIRENTGEISTLAHYVVVAEDGKKVFELLKTRNPI